MRASIAVLALVTPSLAQGDFATGLLQALNSAGLSSLAGAAQTIANTSTGQSLFSSLQSMNATLFAPNNNAFKGVPRSVSSNAQMLANVLAYHVVPGNFASSGSLDAATNPNHTIGRTFLNDSSLVQLEGGKSQVLAWTKNGSNIEVINQPTTTTVSNTTQFQNLTINIVDKVLNIPGNASEAFRATGLTMLDSILTGAHIDTSNMHGYTFFAPNNDALAAAASSLQSLQSNMTALMTVLQNHVINGTTMYSSEVSPGMTSTSAAGSTISFSSDSNGTFVHSGNTFARLVRTDVLTSNGVIHVIDGVLANMDSNPSAASSAFQSATSAAAQTTTQTGPISTPSSSSGSNAASSIRFSGGSVGYIIAFGCTVLGAFAI